MVFSEFHWIPSVIAAVLTVLFSFMKDKRRHRYLSYAMVFFAVIGLVGIVQEGSLSLLSWNLHTFHSWLGIVALLLSSGVFIEGAFLRKGLSVHHCRLGRYASVFSISALLVGTLLLTGTLNSEPSGLPTAQVESSSTLPEVEAKEFQGIVLTPLSAQGNNAILGTQHIIRNTFRLRVTGLVEKNLNYSYSDLLSLPAYSEAAWMPCVEGWGFTAKWTGFRVLDLLGLAGLEPNASYVVFRCSDGYTTGLPIAYLTRNQTLMAYGINDVTLPPERGFPLQLVAVHKYGYKWAKWVTSIEVGDSVVAGYWESRGYSNNADVGSYPFG